MDGIELIKLRGISIKVHPSWMLMLIIFTRIAQVQFSRTFADQFPAWQGWCLGFLTSIFLLLSVVLREIAHSFAALNEGVKVYGITIFSFSGIKSIGNPSSTAMSQLRVASAGPITSISISIVCFSLSANISPILQNLLAQIGVINLLLAVFNLLPALPLDGGVILKSLAWYFTGSERKGHRVAIASGRFFSLGVIILGVLTLTVPGAAFLALFLITFGWFGLTSTRSQDQITIVQQTLSNTSVKEISKRRFRVLEQDQPLKRLSDLGLISSIENCSEEWVLLCSSGRWVGYLTPEFLKDVPLEHWNQYLLADYKKPLSDLPSISEKSPLWAAVLALEKQKDQRLLVFNLAGLPSGTIDKVDLSEIVLKELGLKLPKTILDEARKNNIYPLGISLVKLVEGMINNSLIEKSELDKWSVEIPSKSKGSEL